MGGCEGLSWEGVKGGCECEVAESGGGGGM